MQIKGLNQIKTFSASVVAGMWKVEVNDVRKLKLGKTVDLPDEAAYSLVEADLAEIVKTVKVKPTKKAEDK